MELADAAENRHRMNTLFRSCRVLPVKGTRRSETNLDGKSVSQQ
jgi:hypothetical protein